MTERQRLVCGRAAVAALLCSIAGGCNRDEGTEETDQAAVAEPTTPAIDEQEPERTEVEGQVVKRSIEAVEPTNIGSAQFESGEAEITVRRRVVMEQIEELEVPTLRVCEEYADLNELGAEQLAALGVSRSSAEAIVQHREENGPFVSIAGLQDVPGLSSQARETLRDTVAVRGQAPGTGKQAANGQGANDDQGTPTPPDEQGAQNPRAGEPTPPAQGQGAPPQGQGTQAQAPQGNTPAPAATPEPNAPPPGAQGNPNMQPTQPTE